MALASKVQDNELVIIDELNFGEPCTRDMASILSHLGCDNTSALIATAEYDSNVYKSARNLARVSVSPAAELNALSLLSSRKLVVSKAALDKLTQKEEAVAGVAS